MEKKWEGRIETKKPLLKRLRSRKAGDSALAWQNDAGLASHVVSNHYQKRGLAMATDKHSSVPEGFKEIPGYGGRYFINENGDVWSIAIAKLMSQQRDEKHPYPWLLLRCNDGKNRTIAVHRMMGRTWLELPPGPIGSKKGQYCINHKDGDKCNNNVANLEWVTCEENVRHAWTNGLNQSIGENSPVAKLNSIEVRQIRKDFIDGKSLSSLASEHNMSIQGIHDICRFRRWKTQDADLLVAMKQRSSSIFIDRLIERELNS